jgi:hypothetical protein
MGQKQTSHHVRVMSVNPLKATFVSRGSGLGSSFPPGKYEADRLLNLGCNYYSLDIPVTYTYFNPNSGIDISLTAGLMVNWRNPDTDYRTGRSKSQSSPQLSRIIRR